MEWSCVRASSTWTIGKGSSLGEWLLTGTGCPGTLHATEPVQELGGSTARQPARAGQWKYSIAWTPCSVSAWGWPGGKRLAAPLHFHEIFFFFESSLGWESELFFWAVTHSLGDKKNCTIYSFILHIQWVTWCMLSLSWTWDESKCDQNLFLKYNFGSRVVQVLCLPQFPVLSAALSARGVS